MVRVRWVDYDPEAGIDYFSTKYAAHRILLRREMSISLAISLSQYNTTDFLQIEYFDTYKIVTNFHQDPPVIYILYQCGTNIPDDVDQDDQGGLALTQTPQIPHVE
mmetsp:Transcript_51271/g.57303  ORF Transcript_51271/g.57303 Transcript_51271/m.57303 type:complete len:106 (+) Transcript_51271:252-569(+)